MICIKGRQQKMVFESDLTPAMRRPRHAPLARMQYNIYTNFLKMLLLLYCCSTKCNTQQLCCCTEREVAMCLLSVLSRLSVCLSFSTATQGNSFLTPMTTRLPRVWFSHKHRTHMATGTKTDEERQRRYPSRGQRIPMINYEADSTLAGSGVQPCKRQMHPWPPRFLSPASSKAVHHALSDQQRRRAESDVWAKSFEAPALIPSR